MIKKILVSQPKPSSEKSPYFDIAERHNVEIVFRPFIKVEGVSAKEFRQQKISLTDFTAIVFTSRHAIDHFFALAKELRFAVPEDMKYFCITEQVALYIQKYIQYRKRKIFYGSTGKFADLIPTMAKHKTERYFVPLSDVHSDEIARMLDEKKLKHTEGVMYRTVPNDFVGDEPFDDDLTTCWSSSAPAESRACCIPSPTSSRATWPLPASVPPPPRPFATPVCDWTWKLPRPSIPASRGPSMPSSRKSTRKNKISQRQ